MGNQYKRWGPRDTRALLAAYNSGAPVEEIAQSLARTPKAVASRLRKLRPRLTRPFPDPRGATYRRRRGRPLRLPRGIAS